MIDDTIMNYKCDEYTHGKRCSLCDSTDVSEEQSTLNLESRNVGRVLLK